MRVSAGSDQIAETQDALECPALSSHEAQAVAIYFASIGYILSNATYGSGRACEAAAVVRVL